MPEHSLWAPRRRGLAYLILCAVLAAASGAGCLLAPAGSHLRSYLGGFAVGLSAGRGVSDLDGGEVVAEHTREEISRGRTSEKA